MGLDLAVVFVYVLVVDSAKIGKLLIAIGFREGVIVDTLGVVVA